MASTATLSAEARLSTLALVRPAGPTTDWEGFAEERVALIRLRLTAVFVVLALVASVLPAASVVLGAAPDHARRDKVVPELASLQAQLRAQYPATFGGLWVDESGQPYVAVVGAHAATVEFAEQAALSVRPIVKSVRFSETYLDALYERVFDTRHDFERDGIQLTQIENDTINNTVNVYALNASSAQLATIAGRFGPAVTPGSLSREAVPATCNVNNCPNPLKAGLQLYHASIDDCQSSFVFWNGIDYYLSTAGHCSSLNETKQHPSGTQIGSATKVGFVDGSKVDGALVVITKANASNILYVGSGSTRSMTSREDPAAEVLGEGVCIMKASGVSNCGTLLLRGIAVQVGTGGPWMYDQRKTDVGVVPGDSGSPVYYGYKEMGIASTSLAGGGTSYSHVRNVELKWNVTALLTMP